MLAAIRSVLFILIMAITVTIYATATVLCFFLPVKVRYAIASSWPRLMLQVGRWLCGMRWRVIGTENLPDGPAIVLGKHQSTWETFFLLCHMPRPAAFVFKRELLFIPFFGWAIGMLDMMHIDRRHGRRAFEYIVKSAGKQLHKHGRWIVMFPEGTRSKPVSSSPTSRAAPAGAEERHAHRAGGRQLRSLLAQEALHQAARPDHRLVGAGHFGGRQDG